MPKLILDIETVGVDFETLDSATQEALTRWIKRDAEEGTEEYERALEDMKQGLGFSPLTGEIVVIGVLDYEKQKGVVYFQAPQGKPESFEEDGVVFKPMGEKEMLEQFWQGAHAYDEFVTFNGRSFDLPFLLIRSAAHRVRPTRDLMSNRYITNQRGAVHIDLADQFTFYSAVRRKPSLHLLCRTLGIPSPKEEGVAGSDVARLFREGKYADIARYNALDLKATRALYDIWRSYIAF